MKSITIRFELNEDSNEGDLLRALELPDVASLSVVKPGLHIPVTVNVDRDDIKALVDEKVEAALPDAELGGALRVIAERLGQGNFDWYRERIIKMVDRMPDGAKSPGRVTIEVEHPDRADGLIEHLVEMVTGVACGVSPRPRVLPTNRLLVEFTLPDDTRDAADEVLDFLSSAEQLGATPDGLGWRDADIGELRIWSETPDVPDGVAQLRPGSSFSVRDDLGRELDVQAMAWGGGDGLRYGELKLWPWEGVARDIDPGTIVSNAPLDRGKTYLVIAVEHPDEAIRG